MTSRKAIRTLVRIAAITCWLIIGLATILAGLEQNTVRALAISWLIVFPVAIIAITLTLAGWSEL